MRNTTKFYGKHFDTSEIYIFTNMFFEEFTSEKYSCLRGRHFTETQLKEVYRDMFSFSGRDFNSWKNLSVIFGNISKYDFYQLYVIKNGRRKYVYVTSENDLILSEERASLFTKQDAYGIQKTFNYLSIADKYDVHYAATGNGWIKSVLEENLL